MVGAPKDFHWLFHLTVPLAAPHVSLLIHILILYLSPKQTPGSTHPVSSHVLPYFGIHYPYPASLPLITCLNSNATSIVIFLLFDFLFSYPFSPFLALTLNGLLKALWLATTHKNNGYGCEASGTYPINFLIFWSLARPACIRQINLCLLTVVYAKKSMLIELLSREFCNIKQTTSQNAYILHESLAGNQRNPLSYFFLVSNFIC